MDSDRRVDELALECRTFTSYVLGGPASSEVVSAYQRAHNVSDVEASGASPSLDRALLRIARMGPAWARAADAYAAVFAPSSALRRKLALLVAILESRGESAAAIDTADAGSRIGWILGASVHAATSLLMLCGAVVLVTPLRMWYGLGPSRNA